MSTKVSENVNGLGNIQRLEECLHCFFQADNSDGTGWTEVGIPSEPDASTAFLTKPGAGSCAFARQAAAPDLPLTSGIYLMIYRKENFIVMSINSYSAVINGSLIIQYKPYLYRYHKNRMKSAKLDC